MIGDLLKWKEQPGFNDEDRNMVLRVKNVFDDAIKINGRFELYPTSNNWTFILLDPIDGDAYHVQWGHSKKDRIIYKIKYAAFN